MRSKNESYEPPDESEEWANKRFTIVLDYLCEQQIVFNGEIFLQWLAAPYVSVWNANSLEQSGAKVWIMHNEFLSDCFISREVKDPRTALFEFGKNWKQLASELKRTGTTKTRQNFTIPTSDNERTRFSQILAKHASMLLGIAGDDEVWTDAEDLEVVSETAD